MREELRHLTGSIYLLIKFNDQGQAVSSELKTYSFKKKKVPDFDPQEFKPSISSLAASTFYKDIYKALMKVSKGEIITYKKLAEKAGHPKASRAVGTAMAKNPLVYIVPCHRVLRSDGGLGNYSGLEGPKTKEFLLKFESKEPQI